jgi:serine/threonine protein kinase
MPAAVEACPSARLLERLLAEQLDGAERDSVEIHVERCSTCQGRLELLVEGTAPPAPPAAPLPNDPALEPAAAFLSQLRELSPPGPDGPADAARPIAERLLNGRLGPYEILGQLGKGGMGAVFKARHAELGKVVALKVLPVDKVDELSVARFKKEVRAIGKLDHPNIVVAFDAGQAAGVHYLVMELVDGMDLARVIDRLGRLSVADACEVIRQAAVGLQHAYARGLVHRDVKPSNLMIARDGRVRLLDLGLARSAADGPAEALTAHGVMLGTADYLAPEQWDRPQDADTRSDIYGLGCTLYHALAGRPPFAAGPYTSLPRKMQAHREVPPPPLARLCPEAPAVLVAVVERMLAKDPANRFATPAEVAAALRPLTGGADPARLLAGGDDATRPAAVDIATSAPGDWQTDRERPRPAPARRHRAVPALLAGLALLAVTAVMARPWFGQWSGSPPKPLAVSNMRVLHYRDGGKTLVGDLRTSSVAVRLNDTVRVLADLNTPAHYYLIAFNPRGSESGLEQLCQPEGAGGQGSDLTRPDLRAEVVYPRDTHDFFVDAVGLQAFVLVASSSPLPPYREWRARAGTLPWAGVKDAGEWRWHFDGRTFSRFPLERGRVAPRDDVPEALQKLRDFFMGKPEFEAVQIIAFRVTDDQN